MSAFDPAGGLLRHAATINVRLVFEFMPSLSLESAFPFVRGSLFSCLLDAESEAIAIGDSVLTLLLILLVPSLAFMLWVIWALEMQIRRDRRHFADIALQRR
jgi:hypothetical protein